MADYGRDTADLDKGIADPVFVHACAGASKLQELIRRCLGGTGDLRAHHRDRFGQVPERGALICFPGARRGDRAVRAIRRVVVADMDV